MSSTLAFTATGGNPMPDNPVRVSTVGAISDESQPTSAYPGTLPRQAQATEANDRGPSGSPAS
jgi:hypothetical protein